MLQPVEVLARPRRALRRAVRLDCQVLSELWDEPVPHLVGDLSPHGLWIETPFPLERGSELVLSFTPPGATEELLALAVVRRVIVGRRRGEHLPPGMGVSFVDLSAEQRELLRRCLRGLPPPLPVARRPSVQKEWVWVELLAA